MKLIDDFVAHNEKLGNIISDHSSFGAIVNLGIAGPFITVMYLDDSETSLLLRLETIMGPGWEEHRKFEKTWRRYAKLILATKGMDMGWGLEGQFGPSLYFTLFLEARGQDVWTLQRNISEMSEIAFSVKQLMARKLG